MNEKQKIAYDAFLLGVDWTLKTIVNCGDIYNLTEQEAALFRARAERILKAKERLK